MKQIIKVLYLEDDPLDIDLVQAKLEGDERFTFDIQAATSGQQYEALLSVNAFDIILSDYNLPQYTGLDALKYLNKVQSITPFILLSSAIGDELAVKIIKHGAFDYVLKRHLDTLPMVIERALKSMAERKEKIQWESMFHTIEKAALAGFFRLDETGKYVYTNDYFLEILSCPQKNLIGADCFSIFGETLSKDEKNIWKRIVDKKGSYEKLHQFRTPKNHIKWIKLQILPEVYSETPVGYVGVALDVTSIKETESQLEQIKRYDPVTALINKDEFKKSLQAHLKKYRKTPHRSMLLVTAIDGFNRISESFGQEESDGVLQSIAEQLKIHYGEHAVISRFESGTFAILLVDAQRASAVTQLVEGFNQYLLDNALKIHGKAIVMSLTTAIVNIPESGDTVPKLLQHAAQTLHHAKKEEQGKYSFYSDRLEQQVSRLAELEHALEYGMIHNELYLVYQPQIDIKSNRVVGVETLCRWHSKTLGDVSPSEFIPLAEKTGLIRRLTEHLCNKLFYEIEGWLLDNAALFTPIQTSFNLSASIISNHEFVDFLLANIKKFNLNPESLCFEITETAVMENSAEAKLFMDKLAQQGLSLSIDDFGTGHSSLSYLQSLPVNELKIDASFIKNIHKAKSASKIVKAITELAKTLKLHVVAEGVETVEQLEALKQLKSSIIVQGYYYSKPLTAEELITFLQDFSKAEQE